MTALDAAWEPRWTRRMGRTRRAHPAVKAAMDEHRPPAGEDRGEGRGADRAEEHRPGHGRRRHGPRGDGGAGFGGFGGFPMRPGFPGFPGPHGRRGRKAARGDIRAAVLVLLSERPMHGYQIIQEITERSAGGWRPSPGSVYPTLQQLEDEGLVRTEQADGRRVMHLTEDGTRYVTEHRAALDRVWDSVGDGPADGVVEMREQLGQLTAAVMQVMAAGTDAQVTAARETLTEARKAIYRLLAE